MRISSRHRFTARRERVAAAMVDPAFAGLLVAITDVGAVEVIDHGDDGRIRWISSRLTYDGSLDPVAARVLGSKHPTWVQTYRVDPAAGTGRLTIEPDHHRTVLQCHAQVTLRELDGITERGLEG
jgi:hypothetical protein